MDEAGQQRAIESLRDWSKWLIGLDFGAVAGCVLILENTTDGTLTVTPFLVTAIAFFALSVLSAVVLVRELAHVAEVLPLRDDAGRLTTVFNYPATAGLSIGGLATLQLASLGAGALFFIVWVVVRSIAGG